MKRLGLFLTSAAAGALFLLAIPLAGLIDHAVPSGGNGPMDWYTQLAARQSIALRSAMTAVPNLDDPKMVLRGAGHFQLVCAACHGSPEAPSAQIAQDLSPAPPQLTSWRPDARLFQTVKYGIRHTAMPAWPTEMRDDEVWDMVAFLRLLPTMDAETYARLAHGGAEPGSCAACHGPDGQGRGGAFPRLDIQNPQYVADALVAFRDGSRPSGTMMSVARQFTEGDIAELAKLYGRSTPLPPRATMIWAKSSPRKVSCRATSPPATAAMARVLAQTSHASPASPPTISGGSWNCSRSTAQSAAAVTRTSWPRLFKMPLRKVRTASSRKRSVRLPNITGSRGR